MHSNFETYRITSETVGKYNLRFLKSLTSFSFKSNVCDSGARSRRFRLKLNAKVRFPFLPFLFSHEIGVYRTVSGKSPHHLTSQRELFKLSVFNVFRRVGILRMKSRFPSNFLPPLFGRVTGRRQNKTFRRMYEIPECEIQFCRCRWTETSQKIWFGFIDAQYARTTRTIRV